MGDTRNPASRAAGRASNRLGLAAETGSEDTPAPPNEQAGLILGVDIGATDALALLTGAGELVSIEDMPVLADGPASCRSVNASLLAELVYRTHATRAYVEFVNPRPKEGPIGAFAFGRARGVVERVSGRRRPSYCVFDSADLEATDRHSDRPGTGEGRSARRRVVGLRARRPPLDRDRRALL